MPSLEDAVLLAVDDEKSERDSYRRCFRGVVKKLHVAEGLSEALEILQNERVDLMLVDQLLQETMGTQVVFLARASQSRIKALMVTGHIDLVSEDLEHEAGGRVEVLAKPWTPEELIAACRRAVEGDAGG